MIFLGTVDMKVDLLIVSTLHQNIIWKYIPYESVRQTINRGYKRNQPSKNKDLKEFLWKPKSSIENKRQPTQHCFKDPFASDQIYLRYALAGQMTLILLRPLIMASWRDGLFSYVPSMWIVEVMSIQYKKPRKCW